MSVADKHGNYIGGVILPGLRVSLNSLSGKTAQLPYISLEVPDKVIGKNTIDCMRAGIIFSNVDMIDGLLDRMEKELGEAPHRHRYRRSGPFYHASVQTYDHLR